MSVRCLLEPGKDANWRQVADAGAGARRATAVAEWWKNRRGRVRQAHTQSL